MTRALLRLFVRDYQNTQDAGVRLAYGKLAGAVGIFCNVLLFAFKLVAGTLSGSVSITADAINNLSDASSSVITLLGFKLSEKPADDDHPFGHARIEYISGLAVSALILVIGVELVKTSFEKVLHPTPVEFTPVFAGVLLGSIALKLWMAFFNRSMGRRIGSATLAATSADSRNDVITTTTVLLACMIGAKTGLLLDGIMGLLVALFIIYSGIGIAKDTISPLLGEAADPALVQQIADKLNSYNGVLGFHDLMIHDYGPGRRFASVHVEMDAADNVMACHDIIDDIERDFSKNDHIQLVIHLDPIVTNDEELNRMRPVVLAELQSIDPRLSIHDFRMVRGPGHTNLIFDLVLPAELRPRAQQIKDVLDATLQKENQIYYTVITFDDSSFNSASCGQ